MRGSVGIIGIAILVCAIGVVRSHAGPKGGNPVVILETSKGPVKIELFADKAPISVKNFLTYVREGHYDGLIFHRVIRDFMIQGGGFTKEMRERRPAHPPIKNEASNGLRNDRGTVAMARTGVVDSATSQFFINTVNNDFLNHADDTPRGFGYAVFGRVIEGMEVVDAIRGVPTESAGPFRDVPREPVTILKAAVLGGK